MTLIEALSLANAILIVLIFVAFEKGHARSRARRADHKRRAKP